MRERTICRRGENVNQNTNSGAVAGGRGPFAIAGSKPHYAPDRPFRPKHIRMDLRVYPKESRLEGLVTHRVESVLPEQTEIVLDQIGLEIQEVTLGKEKVDFYTQGQKLLVHLPQARPVGEEFEFAVQYKLQSPKRGMFFTGPDEHHPEKPYQVWTQGQDEDSRYWFPTFDFPNQKATVEVIATVPREFTVLSNGALIEKTEPSSDVVRYHYRLGTPHVTYLTTLVVAELSEVSTKGPHGLPIQYFVAPGREEEGKRSFGNTPKMIEAFEKKTGVQYPFEKYAQVAVQDFIFGGMENTTMTTQTDLTLHDERAHLDFSSDPLVAHELAHQWFGDLLTCRDWSHGWLNEGFATFMERVWVENNTAKGGGFEEAKYYSYQDLQEYLADDGSSYRRPIVCNQYIEPIDLFDSHLYQKGGLVLNLLRSVLGEGLFWKSVNTYVNRHRGQNVETQDLIRAIEDTTGRNLRRFFDEWVFNAGYPEFEVSYQWHDDKKLVEWVIEQKQTQGKPELIQNGFKTSVFHLPVQLQLTLEGGKVETTTIQLGELRDRIFQPAASRPLMARFDPDFTIPKTLKFPRPKEMLLYQLSNDRDCMGRIEAAQELAQILDPEIPRKLGEALLKESFWGAQVEIAKSLSKVRSDSARDALIQALSIAHPKGRRGVVQALSTFKDQKTSDALMKLAQKDESYFVEADAIVGLTQSRFKPNGRPESKEQDELQKFLTQKLEEPSFREVIRSAAIKSFGHFPSLEKGNQEEVLQVLMTWTDRARPMDARMVAIRTLGRILKFSVPSVTQSVLDLFAVLADEDQFRVRYALVLALAEAGLAESIPILERIRSNETDGRIRRTVQTTIQGIRSTGSLSESMGTLTKTLETLEEDLRKLKTEFEKKSLEQQAKQST